MSQIKVGDYVVYNNQIRRVRGLNECGIALEGAVSGCFAEAQKLPHETISAWQCSKHADNDDPEYTGY